MNHSELEQLRLPNGMLRSYTMVGSYPIFYLTSDYCAICPQCATEDLDDFVADPIDCDYMRPRGADVNWEDEHLYCDKCSLQIESAYGENR